MNKLNMLISVMVYCTAMISSSVFAASDGTAGGTSTGTSDVTLTINDRIQISSVADIPLGSYSGSGALGGLSTYCVFRNGGDNYKINLTSSTGAFQIDSASTLDSIPFTVKVDDVVDASVSGESMTHGSDSTTPLIGSSSLTCGGADNASMYVSFAEADMLAVSSGNDYTATVTMLVTPI